MKTTQGLMGFIAIWLLLSACSNGSSDSPVDSSSTSFPLSTTAPVPGTTGESAQPSETNEASILLVVGDWGSGTEPQGAVAGAMSRYASQNEIAAILTTGDNFYTDNADFLMQPFEWARTDEIEFWIAWGNHDIETDERIDALNTTFQSPPRWAVHEWGEVDVIILDSTQVVSSEQAEFLISTLDDSSRPTIVVFHHPVVSCSNHRDTREILERWVSLFDDDVFLVLNGHDHYYQRFVSDNITYVVTGGGGRRLHDVGTCPDGDPSPLAAERRFHFVALEQTNQSLIIQAIDVNGVVLDEARIEMP